MTEEDREYYRQVWGFDPVADRRRVGGKFRYRAEFLLPNDPRLTAASVKIAAEVTFTSRGEALNHIVFLRENHEAHINCTHTVIYSGTMDEALTLAQDGILANVRTIGEQVLFNRAGTAKLPPEEHFVALRSYVAALAEAGIENLLGAGAPPAWDGHDLGISQPFGFNAFMRMQVVAALREIAPSTTEAILRNVFAELVTTGGPGWFQARLTLLNGLYFPSSFQNSVINEFFWKTGISPLFAKFLVEDLGFFELIFEAAPIKNLIRCAVHFPDTPAGVFTYLVMHVQVDEWAAYAFPTPDDWVDLPFHVDPEWDIFSGMVHYYSKCRIPPDGALNLELVRPVPGALKWFRDYRRTLGFWALHHPHFPTTALASFAHHPDPGIRGLVTLHREVAPPLLGELASDSDPHVRLGVACNEKTPRETLVTLASDTDPSVRECASRTARRQ